MNNSNAENIKIYLKDWYFNAGIVGFLRVFGNSSEEIIEQGIELGDNYISFAPSLLDGFVDRYRKHLIRHLLIETQLDQIINDLRNEEKRKKLTSVNWKNATYTVLHTIFEKNGIYNLEQLKEKYATACAAITEARDTDYFYTAKETDAFLTSRFVNFLGRNAVQSGGVLQILRALEQSSQALCPKTEELIEPELTKKKKTKKIKQEPALCAICNENKPFIYKDKPHEYSTSVNVMGGRSGTENSSWAAKDVNICPVCLIIYYNGFQALTQYRNGIYYFVNSNSSITKLFNYNYELSHIKKDADILTTFIDKIKKLSELDDKRHQADSFQFLIMKQNGLIGRPGYDLQQYHVTSELRQFLDAFKPPSGAYQHDIKTNIWVFDDWLKKTLTHTLSWNNLATLFSASIKNSVSVDLFYATKYISEFKKMINKTKGGAMANGDEKNINVLGWGLGNGRELRQKIDQGKREGLAYSLLNSLKTENINEFLNIYMRTMMSYKLPPTFPTEILEKSDSFIQFGYAFLAGLLQGEKKATTTNSNGDNDNV